MAKLVNLWKSREKIGEYLTYPVTTGKIMLYGSSFFTRWGYAQAKQQLAEATDGKLDVINHGFGGATVDELLYHYPRLVTPYNPSAVVIRSGYNDIHQKLTPEETVFLLRRLIGWLQTDNPNIRIFLLNIFDAKILTEETHAIFTHYNKLMADLAAETENVEILDINEFFYEKPEDIGDLSKLRDVFVEDGLHMTDEAYVEFAKFFAPRLLNALNASK